MPHADLDLNSHDPRDWYSIVFLPAQWKGGDDGLRHIRDLHNPGWLHAVGAPISDAGMEHLNSMKSLRALRLVETHVTDQGLRFITSCTGLRALHLEGRASVNGFSDAGLRHIQPLRDLQRLELCGPGFTDEGLPFLRGRRGKFVLALIDTQMTAGGAGRLGRNILVNRFCREEFAAYWPR